MATPTYQEMLRGATTWRGEHMGVRYKLSHHGYRTGDEYKGAEPHPGTWCYYIMIPEQMYAHRWQDFACTVLHGFENPGKAFDHNMFDTEITYSRTEKEMDRREGRFFDLVVIGCDYAHLWHMERGYPDTLESVRKDAIQTVEKFLSANPDRRLQSQYTGRWGDEKDFFTAANGRRVHRQDDLTNASDGWKNRRSA